MSPRHLRALGALAAIAACGGGGWRPVVVGELADASAREVKVEFPDGQNGTQLVLAVLSQAKAAEVATISDFAVQVGRCTRRIEREDAPVVAPSPSPPSDLDAIIVRARESRFTCGKVVEQVLTDSGNGGGDPFGQAQLRDAEMVEKTDCKLVPIEHIVTRYRMEIEHGFTPPDWDEVAKQSQARLRFGPARCGGVPKNEIRARFHAKAKAPAAASALPSSTATPAMIAALVDRAQAAAEAKKPGEATDLAQKAIAAFGDGRMVVARDDAGALELAGRIAQAHFLAVEIEVDTFLRRDLPERGASPGEPGRAAPRSGAQSIDEAWTRDVAADIDRIARRYEHIKDVVRLEPVTRWLRAGAGRLAELHLHLASLLDRAGQTGAAELEREKARQLAARAQ